MFGIKQQGRFDLVRLFLLNLLIDLRATYMSIAQISCVFITLTKSYSPLVYETLSKDSY